MPPAASVPVPPRGQLSAVSVLAAAEAADPGRPRLTWYGEGGERVELSARVLANWVAKTADLLLAELLDPVDPGRSAHGPGRPLVLLDLPVHWRSAVWGLAAWAAGAEVATARDAARPADVVVTADPAAPPATHPSGAPLVVLSLGALDRLTEGAPPGALDYNAVVAGYSDALPSDGAATDLTALLGRPGPPPAAGSAAPRVLVEAGGTSLDDALAALVRALAADGSVVLRGAGAPPAEHLAEVERTTG